MSLLSPGVRAQSPTLQAGDIYGTDFVSGAAAADLAGYVTPFLQSGRLFELTSQWAQGRFIVRDTDANGRPLLGPTSTGSVDGALIAYRLGLRTSPQRPVGVFFLADYFVASHLNSFFDLLTPSKTTPGDNLTGGEWDTGYRGRYYLSWIVPLGLADGGGKTGFAARAFQVLPGVTLSIPAIGLGVQAGMIFRYRDPIDADGRFISRYYLDRFPSDYASSGDIPDGVEGDQRREVFLSAQLFGVEADALLTPAGAPAYISLARNLAMVTPEGWGVRRLVPRLQYFDALAQRARADDNEVYNPSVELTVEREVRGRPLAVTPTLAWLHGPLAFQSTSLELEYFGFVLGGSFQDHPAKGALPGVRVGYAPTAAGVRWLVLDLRYNYVGSAVGALEVLDRPLFTLEVRF
jgi:hypothetical protein